MTTITEVTKDRGDRVNNTQVPGESIIESLEKLEQVMLNLSQNLANMSKRCEAAMQPRECEEILNNIVTAH